MQSRRAVASHAQCRQLVTRSVGGAHSTRRNWILMRPPLGDGLAICRWKHECMSKDNRWCVPRGFCRQAYDIWCLPSRVPHGFCSNCTSRIIYVTVCAGSEQAGVKAQDPRSSGTKTNLAADRFICGTQETWEKARNV